MEPLNISEMTTQHLINRIAWFKRNSPPDPWELHGDEPKYGAGGFMASVVQEEYDNWQAHIIKMEEELERRST